VNSAYQIISSMGLDSFEQLTPRKLFRRIDPHTTKTYKELYEWLEPGELLHAPPLTWKRDWQVASAESFDKLPYTADLKGL
jgi:hypothetical protein